MLVSYSRELIYMFILASCEAYQLQIVRMLLHKVQVEVCCLYTIYIDEFSFLPNKIYLIKQWQNTLWRHKFNYLLKRLTGFLIIYMSPVKRICVFEHSVMTNFNCACPAIQRSQGSGFLSEGSSWLTACMSEQRRFWRDCADAQARLNLRCSHRR